MLVELPILRFGSIDKGAKAMWLLMVVGMVSGQLTIVTTQIGDKAVCQALAKEMVKHPALSKQTQVKEVVCVQTLTAGIGG